MTIPRDEKLKITQRVHAKWSEIYDDRDDVEASDAYFKMYEEAMAEAEEKYKDRPANSQGFCPFKPLPYLLNPSVCMTAVLTLLISTLKGGGGQLSKRLSIFS